MSDPLIDAAIVGGGVVGLAAACAVAARGHTTCVVERLPRPGLEASTHNSGVVHAGLYYPRDSLKAVLCVEGRERLYAFCEEHGVPCARCGKLIVAARADEIGALEALVKRGHATPASPPLGPRRVSAASGSPLTVPPAAGFQKQTRPASVIS